MYFSFRSFNNNTKLLYFGGFNTEGKKTRNIYELNENNQWFRWSVELPQSVGNDTIFPMQKYYNKKCQSPSKSLGKTHFTFMLVYKNNFYLDDILPTNKSRCEDQELRQYINCNIKIQQTFVIKGIL